MVLNMDMDEFFRDENIATLQQLTVAGITAATRMELFGVLNERFIDAQNRVLHEKTTSPE